MRRLSIRFENSAKQLSARSSSGVTISICSRPRSSRSLPLAVRRNHEVRIEGIKDRAEYSGRIATCSPSPFPCWSNYIRARTVTIRVFPEVLSDDIHTAILHFAMEELLRSTCMGIRGSTHKVIVVNKLDPPRPACIKRLTQGKSHKLLVSSPEWHVTNSLAMFSGVEPSRNRC